MSYEVRETPILDEKVHLINLVTVIVENLRLLILVPLIVGLIALVNSSFIEPKFVAQTTFMSPERNSSIDGGANIIGQLSGMGATVESKLTADQLIGYMDSNKLCDQLIDKFNLLEKFNVKYQESARNILKGIANAHVDKKSGLIVVQVEDKDPQFAADLANAYVKELSNMINDLVLKEATGKSELLEKQIIEAMQNPHHNSAVQELLINSLVRDYKATRMNGGRLSFLVQVDIAEPPRIKSNPKKNLIVIFAVLGAGLLTLLFILIRAQFQMAKQDIIFSASLLKIKKAFLEQLGIH